MPHPTCTVCLHADVAGIDEALRTGSPSMRELAKQSGLSLTAIYRHKQHAKSVKGSVIKNIPEEIRKLKIMLNAAKRRKDTNGALSISREIRAWVMLEAKVRPIAPTEGANADDVLSLRDALTVAKSLIESQLSDPDVRAWLESLRATGTLPDAQE